MKNANAKKLIKEFQNLMKEDSESARFCRESKMLYKKHAIYEPNTLMKKIDEIDFDNKNIYDLVEFTHEIADLTNQAVNAVYNKEEYEKNKTIDAIEDFFVYTAFLPDLKSLESSLKETSGVEKVKLSARMIEILSQEQEVSFERKCQNVCFVVQDVFENWHKKLLIGMLNIVNLYNKKNSNMPNTYGAIIQKCNNEKIFPYIVNDDFRILRNSIAHRHTEFNVEEEKIKFINIKNNGNYESTKFYNWDEFRNLIEQLFWECRILTLMFRKTYRILNKFSETDDDYISFLKELFESFKKRSLLEEIMRKADFSCEEIDT